ncbi:hypothetical protein ACRYCC_14895 [Actinomadura scrupuli]|uniref:hypothetical protein n=1 Tax=Actinomadura scrupuli TaxID=559629 RepID=UPI003D98C7A1
MTRDASSDSGHNSAGHDTGDHAGPRKPAAGRARKRAIRALALHTGVPYSVAARQIDAADRSLDWYANEMLAAQGRTVYPPSTDTHRQWLISCRSRRPFGQRLQDTRLASRLPGGRGRHLADRFPPTRGEEGTGVGPLYHGEGRQDALALLYAVVLHETPECAPSPGELAWMAELGEETAVDIACADLDRTARRLLDHDRDRLRPRVEATLAAGRAHDDWRLRQETVRLATWYRAARTDGLPFDGARHILDALLVIGDDGHAPGTRVRMLGEPRQGRIATIVGAQWGPAGPPVRYLVRPDADPAEIVADPYDLVLLYRHHDQVI